MRRTSGRQRRSRSSGVIPRLGRGFARGFGMLGRACWRHPQPAFLGVVLGIAGWGLWRYLGHAESFRVAHVVMPVAAPFRVPDAVIGANLWTLDIEALSYELRQQQPWLQDVRVIRQFPNAVRIDALPRVPIAQVHADRWYLVDRAGVLWPAPDQAPSERLIRLAGIGPVGKPGQEERLQLALRVLEKVRRTRLPLSHRVTELDIADTQQLRLILDDETEVRCGSELELDLHLKRLRAALKAIIQQPLAVQYIDVRFQDPVARPRT